MVQPFSFQKTQIEGLTLITPFISEDIRGRFIKDYAKEIFEQNGCPHILSEVFYTQSHAGVVRGMHFQRIKTQAKLVRCLSGHIYDVVVDLRKDAPTFGTWQGFDLTAENHHALLIPGTCAHGYLVLAPSIVSYQCDEKFYGAYDDGIAWDDVDLAIAWPTHLIDGAVILSDRDKTLQTFKEFRAEYRGL